MKLFSAYQVQDYFQKFGYDISIKEIRKVSIGSIITRGTITITRVSIKNWIA